jgi:5-methylcytosine-specific restriction enzyme subunit McrC
MLAYCTAYRLARGHLVSVTGNQQDRSHRIRNVDVEIVLHSLDLNRQPDALLGDIDQLAERIIR